MTSTAKAALRLARDAFRILPGGVSPVEGRVLLSDGLALAAALSVHAPAVIAPVLGSVLAWGAAIVAHPPQTVGDAIASLLAALDEHVPAEDGGPRHRPEPEVTFVDPADDGAGEPAPNEPASG